MGIRVKIIIAVTAVFFFLLVLRAIRSSTMRPTFALLWLAITAFLLSIPLLEHFYKWLSVSVIGIDDARHLIYIPLVGFLLLYVFYMTNQLAKMSDRIQELITHTAILDTRVRELAPSRETGGGG